MRCPALRAGPAALLESVFWPPTAPLRQPHDPSPPDRIYATALDAVPAFVFDERVAAVFDDMIRRSVPGYGLTLAGASLIAARHARSGARCYDLGCSLGAGALAMAGRIDRPGCRVVAVDNALPMARRCRELMARAAPATPVDVLCADIRDVVIDRAAVVVLNFTLQFVPVADRAPLLRRIHRGLLPGGVLMLSEKIRFEDAETGRWFADLHHEYKRAEGYSDLEIAQKRAALERVLIPETAAVHRHRLGEAGFHRVETWFQCFNFVSFLACK